MCGTGTKTFAKKKIKKILEFRANKRPVRTKSKLGLIFKTRIKLFELRFFT
jgi:hypothetical protein